MGELITLSGVARKTANIILGNAFGIVEGIAVDTHVRRLSQKRLVQANLSFNRPRPLNLQSPKTPLPKLFPQPPLPFIISLINWKKITH